MRRRWRRGWAAVIVFCFFLSHLASAQTQGRPPSFSNKQSIEFFLRNTSQALNGYRDYSALIQNLPRKSDRDYLLSVLGESAHQAVRVRYVERQTLVVDTIDGRSVLFVEDPYKQRFQLYKHRFVFNPQESAEAALKRMRKIFNSKVSARGALIFSEAEASPAILGVSLAGMLTIRTFSYLYLAAWGVTSSACVQTKQNSIGQCALLGLAWPGVVAVMATGSIAAGFQKIREKTAPAAFALEDLQCQESGGSTLNATMRDDSRDRLDLELNFTPKGEPKSLILKPEVSASRTIFFKSDWSIDTDKTSGAGSVIGPMALDLIAKGAKSLLAVCLTTDGRKALEEYFFKTRNDQKVIPKIDDSGISAKTVK